jgi:hypothetical protein
MILGSTLHYNFPISRVNEKLQNKKITFFVGPATLVLGPMKWYYPVLPGSFRLRFHHMDCALLLISNTKISHEMKLHSFSFLNEACPIPISKWKFKKDLDTVTN